MRRFLALLGISGLLMAPPFGAAAAPADRAAPEASGPVMANGDPSCDGGKAETTSGLVLGTYDICISWFRFVPGFETDIDRDHGALWLEVGFDAAPGWCLTDLRAKLIARPDNTDLGATVPTTGGKRFRSAARPKIVLTLDGDGTALQEASLADRARYQRGRITTGRSKSHGEAWARWQGDTSKPVELLVGAEIAWDAGLDDLADIYELGGGLEPFLRSC